MTRGVVRRGIVVQVWVVNKSLHKKLITYLDKLDLIRYIIDTNNEV